jgi:hypothetical protein
MWRAMPVVLLFLTASAAAQDGDSEAAAREESDREAERCVRVSRIRRTKVIDDQNIAFYMRNRDVYINSLPRRCPQLANEDRFAYTARGGQLCSTDVITVLQQFAGRLEAGFTCRLGEYVPTDAETIDIMIAAEENRGVTPPASGEVVELPPEEEAEQAEEQE